MHVIKPFICFFNSYMMSKLVLLNSASPQIASSSCFEACGLVQNYPFTNKFHQPRVLVQVCRNSGQILYDRNTSNMKAVRKLENGQTYYNPAALGGVSSISIKIHVQWYKKIIMKLYQYTISWRRFIILLLCTLQKSAGWRLSSQVNYKHLKVRKFHKFCHHFGWSRMPWLV